MAEKFYTYLLGGFVFVGLSLLFSCLGLSLSASSLIALLLALTIAFLYKRRKFHWRQLQEFETEQSRQVETFATRLQHFYNRSPAALVTVDTDNWIVIRASSGFAKLMGLEPDMEMKGAQIAALLKVQPAQINALEAYLGDPAASGPMTLVCRGADGDAIELDISGIILEEDATAELVFARHLPARSHAEEREEIEEFDLFRKMMMRREARILELKSEVNCLLLDKGDRIRYAVDANTSDHRLGDLEKNRLDSNGS